MSYTILYRRIFVRMPDGRYLALVESGDNNVYDTDWATGRQKRARSWTSWHFSWNERPVRATYSREEINDWLDHMLQTALHRAGGEDGRRSFGSYASYALAGSRCGDTTWSAFRSFFAKGLEKAVTLEELLTVAGALRIEYWCRENGHLIRGDVRTAEALEEAWREAVEVTSDGIAWVVPSNRTWLGLAADCLAASGKKGYLVHVRRSTTTQRSWIASAFPFRLAESRDEAMAIPAAIVEKENLFSFVNVFDRTIDGMGWSRDNA